MRHVLPRVLASWHCLQSCDHLLDRFHSVPGVQVLVRQPKWALDIQRRPLTLLPRAARPRGDDAEQGCDAAEAAARRLMAQASVAALAKASQLQVLTSWHMLTT